MGGCVWHLEPAVSAGRERPAGDGGLHVPAPRSPIAEQNKYQPFARLESRRWSPRSPRDRNAPPGTAVSTGRRFVRAPGNLDMPAGDGGLHGSAFCSRARHLETRHAPRIWRPRSSAGNGAWMENDPAGDGGLHGAAFRSLAMHLDMPAGDGGLQAS
jgi:hypothetical protein